MTLCIGRCDVADCRSIFVAGLICHGDLCLPTLFTLTFNIEKVLVFLNVSLKLLMLGETCAHMLRCQWLGLEVDAIEEIVVGVDLLLWVSICMFYSCISRICTSCLLLLSYHRFCLGWYTCLQQESFGLISSNGSWGHCILDSYLELWVLAIFSRCPVDYLASHGCLRGQDFSPNRF